MNLIKIIDIHMPELEIYHKLRDNAFDAQNSFVADSPKVVNVLVQDGVEVKSILATKEYYDEFADLLISKNIPKLFVATKDAMQKIVGHKIHHNCMMHGIRPKQTKLEDLTHNIVMLDEITSSQNVGSIARSMAGLGVESLVLPSFAPHPYGRRALRVSMGYISHLRYHIYDDIFSTCQALKKMGYKIFAAEVTKDSTPLWHVKTPQKWVILLGHEGKGLSQEILDICDEVVTIEMKEDVKSLNVAVAASLMMYQFKNRG
jgi:tRNA G18 (ribose-2'-O)-methylase SpoU